MAVIPPDEPVAGSALLNAALIATLNIPALIFDWNSEVVAAINLTIGAWVVVLGWFFTRRQVSPESNIRAVSPQTADALFGDD